MVAKIFLLCVLGTGGLSADRCKELGQEAKRIYAEETRIRLRFVKIRIVRDPFGQRYADLDSGGREVLFQLWQGFVGRKYSFQTHRIYALLLPPLLGSGRAWLTGASEHGCYRSRLGPSLFYVRAKETGDIPGADYFYVSLVGFLHELGHVLGASHQGLMVEPGECNIMHPDAYSCGINFGEQHFEEASRLQMYGCLGVRFSL